MTLLDKLTSADKAGLFIGGDWLPASDGRIIEVCNPATEEVLAEVASALAADGLAAVGADAAADSWAAPAPRARGETLRRAFELLIAAAAGSARVLTGGGSPEGTGFFYLPTVLADIEADAPMLGEEIFGPVALVVTFEGLDQAITMANDTAHGLISYVYTGDTGRGIEIAEALEAGMVAVNRGPISDAAAPFGGMKQSGVGREGAHHGLMEYLEPKYIGV